MDQRICIKFCVKNKIKCADAFRMLTKAYGEATLDRSNVYRWYKMFSEGREDVNDEERAGRPSTSTTDENIDEVKKIVLANRRITVREVAEDLNISIGSCHSIFTNDLGMRRSFRSKCLREEEEDEDEQVMGEQHKNSKVLCTSRNNSFHMLRLQRALGLFADQDLLHNRGMDPLDRTFDAGYQLAIGQQSQLDLKDRSSPIKTLA
ncbi:PREDICTED: putative uncharacterized protein FLJ37770 [Wasmannia auropunctata]|uniref:putative uncharacterized protein FLJ37770 n=1 Tax=Wasmannia auropunctata TaxID=64793 RepID=UPI0005EF4FD8|nr:PREDICTED: putative uncharacterized protein FLJ37770 [Wasmannia auropunctata]